MTNPSNQAPISQSDLRRMITRLLDRTVDAHQTIQAASSQLDAIDIDIRNIRSLCLRTLCPDENAADTIIPGMDAVYHAIEHACHQAKTPIGCAEVAKSAAWHAIWQRMTQIT